MSVDKLMYSRRNEAFGKTHKFLSCGSEHCKNVTALSIATGPSLNLAERLPISSNHNENHSRWQQMLNGQYSKMSVNRASTIYGYGSMEIKQCFGRC
jgi:hypothetical protein